MQNLGNVYIMSSRRNGTLYIGVTSDLVARVYAHREGLIRGFTKRYGCKMLVWYAAFDDIQDARQRELQMKEWRRSWKIEVRRGATYMKISPDELDPGFRRGTTCGQ